MKKLSLLTILIIALISTNVYAQPGGPKKGNRMLFDSELNLNDQQKEQITDIRDQARLKAVDLGADVRKAEIELEQMMRSDSGISQLEKQVDKVSQSKARVIKSGIRVKREIRELLTAEQRKVYDLKYSQLRGPRRDEMKRCGMRGPGKGAKNCRPGGNRFGDCIQQPQKSDGVDW